MTLYYMLLVGVPIFAALYVTTEWVQNTVAFRLILVLALILYVLFFCLILLGKLYDPLIPKQYTVWFSWWIILTLSTIALETFEIIAVSKTNIGIVLYGPVVIGYSCFFVYSSWQRWGRRKNQNGVSSG
jgi:hypothetical protein